MRHDPIEFAMVGSAARQRRTARRLAVQAPTSTAIDEAFADFAERVRIDPGVTGAAATNESQPLKKALVASLAAHVDALDRQRERLVQLLRNIDLDSVSG